MVVSDQERCSWINYRRRGKLLLDRKIERCWQKTDEDEKWTKMETRRIDRILAEREREREERREIDRQTDRQTERPVQTTWLDAKRRDETVIVSPDLSAPGAVRWPPVIKQARDTHHEDGSDLFRVEVGSRVEHCAQFFHGAFLQLQCRPARHHIPYRQAKLEDCIETHVSAWVISSAQLRPLMARCTSLTKWITFWLVNCASCNAASS